MANKCSVDDCERPARAKGMCRKHYNNAYNARPGTYTRSVTGIQKRINANAAKRGAVGTVSLERVAELLTVPECLYCRAELQGSHRHFDHIQPIARGGANVDSNIQAICPDCNRLKWDKTHDEYVAHLQATIARLTRG